MRITKIMHACGIVENDGIVVLIDPGNYAFTVLDSNIETLPKIDYILVTHSHPDHFYIPFIKNVAAKNPDVKIISNEEITDLLINENISVSKQKTDFIKMQDAKHEKALKTPVPQNTLFTIFGKITDPGDSLDYHESKEILFLPIQGSWESVIQALTKAIEVKPKVVIPIHDWHFHDEARKWTYENAEKYLTPQGIRLIKIESMIPVEI